MGKIRIEPVNVFANGQVCSWRSPYAPDPAACALGGLIERQLWTAVAPLRVPSDLDIEVCLTKFDDESLRVIAYVRERGTGRMLTMEIGHLESPGQYDEQMLALLITIFVGKLNGAGGIGEKEDEVGA